ncbi:MAG: 2-C-methyl-D-erythritol 4-phosphate cytidylyltransferase [Piscirickettsiaceae bacterium]|nr:MAG: 2-C-methyl-D-erythritol 4-phosphate cytidylyltransferase [Piscirickettsiaceae bacterium]
MLTAEVCCIVPAAGVGKRMQTDIPKQYLPFRSVTILEHTLSRLLSCPFIKKIILVISKDDVYWPLSSYYGDSRVIQVEGGAERADSVFNGLVMAEELFGKESWALVHDAARPCVMASDVERLANKSASTHQGSILAAPIHDTIKQTLSTGSIKTLDRTTLWRALTPQLFQINALKNALINAKQQGKLVTDEASAIEMNGGVVELVEGRTDNIKVTTLSDLSLANYFVEQQEKVL